MTAAKKTGMSRRHFLLAGATVLGTTVVVTACSNANGTKVVEVTLDAIVAKMTATAPTSTPSATATQEATPTPVPTENSGSDTDSRGDQKSGRRDLKVYPTGILEEYRGAGVYN